MFPFCTIFIHIKDTDYLRSFVPHSPLDRTIPESYILWDHPSLERLFKEKYRGKKAEVPLCCSMRQGCISADVVVSLLFL